LFLTKSLRSFVSTPQNNDLKISTLKDSNYPRFSIVTPSFNQARFLERTILSVLNQGYPNLEYIIIDGGSTDGSVDIIKKYEPYLSYWVSEPDHGQANAINKGLRIATGEWVGFQNSDDLYLPGAFFSLARAIESNRDAEIVYGNIVHIDSDDNVYDVQMTGPAHRWLHVAQGIQFHNQATIWRRSLLEKVGYLDEGLQFCMDFEYFGRLIFGERVRLHHVDQFLGAFRAHPSAKSKTMLETAQREHSEVVRKFGRGYGSPTVKQAALALAKIYKALWYILHGKGWYVMRNWR